MYRYYDIIEPHKSDVTFQNYGSVVDNGFNTGDKWTHKNITENKSHHRVLVGWCLAISQQFVLSYAYICHQLTTWIPFQDSLPSFGELLSDMGVDASCKKIFDACGTFDPVNNLEGTWKCTLVDHPITIDFHEILSSHPLQLNIVDGGSIHKATIATTGKGWDNNSSQLV